MRIGSKIFLLLTLVFSGVCYSNTFSSPTANPNWNAVGQGADMLMLAPVNEAGISVNIFDTFKVDSPLQLLNRQDSFVTTADSNLQLIVIKANQLDIESDLSLVSSLAADILFINQNNDGIIQCKNCGLSNFKRITFAVANAGQAIGQNLSSLGVLSTKEKGVINVNGFSAKGSVAVDFIANSINSSGTITTMEKGLVDRNGGYSLAENGNLTIASSGINFYSGNLSISLADGRVESSKKNTQNRNSAIIFNSKVSAASISIVSAKPVTIGSSAQITTQSDIVMSSTYKDELFVPVEGINIMTLVNTAEYGELKITGKLLTDNEVNLVSANNIFFSGTNISEKLTVLAQNNLVNTGYIDVGGHFEGSANFISNRGQVKATTLDLRAEDSLFNHFGGRMLANKVNLDAGNLVINGSRTEQQPAMSPPTDLIISDTLNATFDYGTYNINDFNTASTNNVDTSAHIIASKLYINSGTFENINPYFRVRASIDIWDETIDFDYSKTKQVKILAEEVLQIASEKYVINSSAVIGLEQDGDFTINTPKLMNERYRVDTSGYIFSRKRQNSQNETHSSYGSGIEAHIDAFSPMAVIYSYGDFNYSPITAASSSTFINLMSYMQIHGVSNFFNTELSSLGIITGTGEVNNSVTPDSCLVQNCSRDKFTDSFVRTTFTSFLNDVYGLSTDFVTSTEVQVEAQEQALVDAYIADYIATHTVSFPTDDPRGRSQRFNTAIETISNQDILVITEYMCQLVFIKADNAMDRACTSDEHRIYVSRIVADYAEDLIIPGTLQTDAQIKSMGQTYLDKDTFRSVEIIMDNRNPYEPIDEEVSGFWVKRLSKYRVIDSNSIEIFYRNYFYESYNRNTSAVYIARDPNRGREYSMQVPYSTFRGTKPATPAGLTVNYNKSSGRLEFGWGDVYSKNRTFNVAYKAPSTSSETVRSLSEQSHAITFAKDGTVQFKVRSCVAYPNSDGANTNLCSNWSNWHSETVDYTERVEPPECRRNCCTGRDCPIEP